MDEKLNKVGRAYLQVLGLAPIEEKKAMDPVNPGELKGTHSQRKDKDINNDGKVDSSDEYLHKRRQAISKAMKKEAWVDPKTQMGSVTVTSDDERKKRAQAYRDKKAASMKKEEVEELDEISSEKLGKYKKAANKDLDDIGAKLRATGLRMTNPHDREIIKGSPLWKKAMKRSDGISTATRKKSNKDRAVDESNDGSRFASAIDRAEKKRQAAIKKAKEWMKRTGKSAEAAAIEFDLLKNDISKLKENREIRLVEDITKMSNGRLKWHMNTGTPHGSYTRDEMKKERDRRMKYADSADAYRKAKPVLEEVEHSHKITKDITKGSDMKESKAPGATANLEPKDDTRDTHDKQLSTRKGEKDFVGQHKIDSPEFLDAEKVNMKTFKSFTKDIKVSKKRWNDQDVGDKKPVKR